MFRPRIRDLIEALESNPKQFEKKKGPLKHARSVTIAFADGIVWRCVATLNESERIVRVLALGPHDDAYIDASRRS